MYVYGEETNFPTIVRFFIFGDKWKSMEQCNMLIKNNIKF